MKSPKTQGRLDGVSRAELDAEAAAGAVQIDTDDILEVADILATTTAALTQFREQLMEPGLASILYRPQTAGLATSVKGALQDAANQLGELADDTFKIATLFAEVDSRYFGGVSRLAWEQFVEAQITDPDDPLAFLERIESPMNRKVGPASFKNANDLRSAIESYQSLVTFQDAITTTGLNRTIEQALRGGVSKKWRKEARLAIAEALGVKPHRNVAGAVVAEYISDGPYANIDELIARVSLKNHRSVNASQANLMRRTLLDAAPRFARRPAVLHAALADRTTSAAARSAGLIDRVPGVLTSRKAVAANVSAAMNKQLAGRSVGGAAKGVARKAFVVVDVVMIPIDVRNVFVADSNLGKVSAGTSAASGALAVAAAASAAGIISAPAAPFLALGSGVLFVTSMGLGFADGRNQQQQAEKRQKEYEAAYNKAYEEAYPAAFQEALNDRIDDQVQAANAKFEARRAKVNKAPRATPAPLTVQRAAVRASRVEATSGVAA